MRLALQARLKLPPSGEVYAEPAGGDRLAERDKPFDPLAPGPTGFAHRGLHGASTAPENSFAAFEAAVAAGAGIECDLSLGGYDEVIVSHPKRAPQTRASVSTLKSVLAMVGGRVPLLLDLKVQDDARRWAHALAQPLANYRGRFAVISDKAVLIRLLKDKSPTLRRGLMVRHRAPAWKRRMKLWLAQPDFVAVEWQAARTPWLARLRDRMPVYAFTIRTPEQRAQAEPHFDALIWEAEGRPPH